MVGGWCAQAQQEQGRSRVSGVRSCSARAGDAWPPARSWVCCLLLSPELWVSVCMGTKIFLAKSYLSRQGTRLQQNKAKVPAHAPRCLEAKGLPACSPRSRKSTSELLGANRGENRQAAGEGPSVVWPSPVGSPEEA